MKLLRLLRFIPTRILWMSIAASFLASAGNIAIVALISRRLNADTGVTSLFVLQFAALALAVVAIDFGVKWLLARLTGGIGYGLRTNLSRRIVQTPLAALEAIGAPRLLAALTDDVYTLVLALGQFPSFVMSAAILLGCLLYLAWLSPISLLLAGLFTLPAVAGQVWIRQKAQRKRARAARLRDELYRHYRALTDGAKELKMHRGRRGGFLAEVLEPTARAYEEANESSRALHHLATAWAQAIYFLFILALFAIAGIWQVDRATLTSFALIALYARSSMTGLFTLLPFLSDATVAAQALETLGLRLTATENADLTADAQPTRPPAQPLCLQLQAVSRAYTPEDGETAFQLGPIDLEMQSGELIFLIGGNGSGKTTLAKLLLGLYTPESGQIEWNGRAVSPENLDDYRQIFAAVFADFYLFDQLLGLDGQSGATQAVDYLQQLQLAHKVQVRDGRLSTLALSTGQRQRLALLTALLEDRPAYLFDEWAAGQDPYFKELFYHHFLPELRNRGKLVVVISHDDRYFSVADRIVKLDFGRIESDVRLAPVTPEQC